MQQAGMLYATGRETTTAEVLTMNSVEETGMAVPFQESAAAPAKAAVDGILAMGNESLATAPAEEKE